MCCKKSTNLDAFLCEEVPPKSTSMSTESSTFQSDLNECINHYTHCIRYLPIKAFLNIIILYWNEVLTLFKHSYDWNVNSLQKIKLLCWNTWQYTVHVYYPIRKYCTVIWFLSWIKQGKWMPMVSQCAGDAAAHFDLLFN